MKTQNAKLQFNTKSIIDLQAGEMFKINGGTSMLPSITATIGDLIDHIQNCGGGEDMCNGHSAQK